jgi:hypothetical protein
LPITGSRPGDEGDQDHGLGERQVDAEQRQDQHQVDRGQRRVQRRDADLREDDAAERLAEARDPLLQRPREHRQFAGRPEVGQRHHGADDHADQEMQQHAAGALAEILEVARMDPQPLAAPAPSRSHWPAGNPGPRAADRCAPSR